MNIDLRGLRATMTERAIGEQTKRLVTYAQEEIKRIGDRITTYASMHHMDDKGNLLDSLCWGVWYRGEMCKSGFYRQALASKTTYLHAFSPSIREEVNGHAFAKAFLDGYSPRTTSGWEVLWGVLAPYWGYWESGFKFKTRGRVEGEILKFAVMTEEYDNISKVFGSNQTLLEVHVPSYTLPKDIDDEL